MRGVGSSNLPVPTNQNPSEPDGRPCLSGFFWPSSFPQIPRFPANPFLWREKSDNRTTRAAPSRQRKTRLERRAHALDRLAQMVRLRSYQPTASIGSTSNEPLNRRARSLPCPVSRYIWLLDRSALWASKQSSAAGRQAGDSPPSRRRPGLRPSLQWKPAEHPPLARPSFREAAPSPDTAAPAKHQCRYTRSLFWYSPRRASDSRH